VPLKIKILMWLVQKQKILTRDNLIQKGWIGSSQCCFCASDESVVHLFLACPFAQQVWFWMGNCQLVARSWADFDEVISFDYNLSSADREAFLAVLCVVCWSMWKLRNDVTFQRSQCLSIRSLVILICSLLNYWSGSLKDCVVRKMQCWMPASIDFIPLQVLASAIFDLFHSSIIEPCHGSSFVSCACICDACCFLLVV
jgi:zinc-binding in reverse transcriptase